MNLKNNKEKTMIFYFKLKKIIGAYWFAALQTNDSIFQKPFDN